VKGEPCKPDHYLRLAEAVRQFNRHLKINTVVCRENANEDMSAFVSRLSPERWKIFQVLHIRGQNDKGFDDFSITNEEFDRFVERQKAGLRDSSILVVPEDNRLMTGSYAMVDPQGRFFDDIDGTHRYGRPILEVGLQQAWEDIRFNLDRFVERGGQYYFRKRKC
jgi:radical S-adenosyl methionine domain-containing protein 2